MSKFDVIVPARFGSTRFPGKPLHQLAGKTMLEHVVNRAHASGAGAVHVATDDERIRQAMAAIGQSVLMTSPEHPSGTDRLEEAARLLALDPETIVVNVQGDEPLIPPAVITQAATLLDSSAADVASLYEPFTARHEVLNPNAVKVVLDLRGRALYFSRAPIPFVRDHAVIADDAAFARLEPGTFRRHVGIYAYRVRALTRFVELDPSPLETLERLEQLRLLSSGLAIQMAAACEPIPAGVDTPEDAQRVAALLNG
ncbi:MAG: 3-deoxy-manno-octulosonate cytidylyltransferase [Pseudomonadota bacterium]